MPKQTKALTVKQEKQIGEMIKSLNPVALKSQDLLPPQLMQMLEDKMPAWIKDYVADGTSVIRWNWEFLIILEQILVDRFNFTEEEIIKLEKDIKKILPRIEKFKAETPRLITKEDFAPGLKMVKRNKKLFVAQQGWNQLEAGEQKQLK